ncbi:MAG: alkaline phosphatase family protein [Syntrophomonadaceae bacterium]|jgi:predicted AlkP superfamily pyrophosphatase or phosphodiesterase
MKNILFPSPTANLVNVANSILKKYGIATYHNSLPELDEILKKHDRIVFILLDGAGEKVIEKTCKTDSILRNRPKIKITSIFPPTTVAATNAFLSGRYPSENGWLGWSQYFIDLNRALDVFANIDSWTREKLPGHVMNERCPIQNIFNLIREKCQDVHVDIIMPSFVENGAKNLGQFYRKIRRTLKNKKSTLIYAYWIEPDATMHARGTKARKVRRVMNQIDRRLKKLELKEPDTLFVILADHGMTDVEFLNICEHNDFFETLIRPHTLEGRAANFYVKNEFKHQFEQTFYQYYGKYFRLYTRSEVIKEKLFGPAPMSDKARVFLGDYLAVAIDKYAFHYSPTNAPKKMKGHHAGLLEEEMSVQITLLNYKK